ncbi:MAG: hypothetical protein P5694_09470 [Limnospira sp. PMC 1286.21]|nr:MULTISPECIES: hypothetical protein [unclassified Limnospira]EKD11250.1 hypothetical protein SPLC1_S030800 [Arthrospira platensis C1]MDT9193353.1 hypothetical protein [Limnospira sp. PMC 1245.20]MDT9203654.1 hypothetical protein [Limnospira sp. PMC 1243.20]MDT9325962.1 hypothetical protein [Limnospira sp. PMC 1286.21]
MFTHSVLGSPKGVLRNPIFGKNRVSWLRKGVYVSPGGVGFPQVGAIALQ